MNIKKGGLPDLIFSWAFVFAAVFVWGLALKEIWVNQYMTALIFIVISIYSFGAGCMGLYRLLEYMKGNRLNRHNE